ncbi:MAG TPA: PilZ domain-containing protein [Lysobacter sp.]
MDQIEKRRHPRQNVVSAVMVSPNGDQHSAQLMDISLGGARVALPDDWTPSDGQAMRVFFFADTADAMVLAMRITRVTVDHLGLEFAPEQEGQIQHLLEVLLHCR